MGGCEWYLFTGNSNGELWVNFRHRTPQLPDNERGHAKHDDRSHEPPAAQVCGCAMRVRGPEWRLRSGEMGRGAIPPGRETSEVRSHDGCVASKAGFADAVWRD